MVMPKRVIGMMQVVRDGNLTFVRRKKASCDCERIQLIKYF
jgi:hypothetical protein